MSDYTINVRGRLLSFKSPVAMGILNATPDSFFAGSRYQTERAIAERANKIVADGGAIIDVGACSTRPGAVHASEHEEMERMRSALRIVSKEQPDAALSIDTFRPDVARMAVEEFGASIINDVYGGNGAKEMFHTVARLGVAYVLTSSHATVEDMVVSFARDIQVLRDFGAKDIIIDPGFGFGKSLEQNHKILSQLDRLTVLELPLLVGMSRKSMITRLLGVCPEEALNGTTVLNTIALMKGASILRVHDVKEAVEAIRLTTQNQKTKTPNQRCSISE